ncbi:MAG TPA: CDGSH iron-sulfur domain-containing protein [Rickettsiales bacterium]|nr:CDGSH iron-sulfur domain-containing protein [Rickettsiales bacterium]
MQNLPKIAGKAPIKVAVEAGKKYFWCSCGFSLKQPFCDGAHKNYKGADGLPLMKPVIYESTENKTVYFCVCKHSKNGVFCDGTHSKLA